MDKADIPFKILVVDDNPKNIQVIGTLLREADYEVGFATDGQQALDLLQANTDYDLVLLDIKMPVLDGYETCRLMKKDVRLKEIPVIFLSASRDTENIVTGFDIGGVDYLTKPFNSKELLARVHTHVQLKQKTLEVTNYAMELEKVNATKDKFFSIIAHDLRNPFAGILMVSKTILQKLTSLSEDEIRTEIEMIHTSAESAHKLLENLLIWARSQTGNIAYKPYDVPLDLLIKQCITSTTAQATAKDIRIIYKPCTEITLMTDVDMFCNVLINLMTNAIKFTKKSGTVTLSTHKTHGNIEVSVSDTGIGISPNDIGNLFRIDGNIGSQSGTQDESGSGLGLILCKEFIDKMGGTIRAESEPDKGSKFTFTLPLNTTQLHGKG